MWSRVIGVGRIHDRVSGRFCVYSWWIFSSGGVIILCGCGVCLIYIRQG